MLKRLYIKNYALLKEITVQFERGLNIITGETGAGKSIIMEALTAILGERIDSDVIGKGDDKVIIEGEFQIPQIPQLQELLRENDIPVFDKDIIIRREMSPSGRTRAYVNDQPTSVPVLEKVGDLLVDLHGQHEHQSLLHIDTHCTYLDAFGQLHSLAQEVKTLYSGLLILEKNLQEQRDQEKNLRDMVESYKYQLEEIKAFNPQPDEDKELEQEERILKNAEFLYEKSANVYSELYDSDGAIIDRLGAAISTLEDLGGIDSQFGSLKDECISAKLSLDEIASSLQRYISHISFNPARLESIRLRISHLNGLKKKYGGTIENILKHKSECENKINQVTNYNLEIENLENEIISQRKLLGDKSIELSQRRKESATVLAEKITNQLSKLGMGRAEFRVSIQHKIAENDTWIELNQNKYQVNESGIDFVEFQVNTNPGEGFKPLVKIASGGEISRIMLALKTALSEVDLVPVLVFDEIDNGISGRIAQSVGKSLKELSVRPQVIAITHLPQIASVADHHYYVEKTIEYDSTVTTIRKLQENERVEHIARLLGGERVTEAHLKSAADLITEGKE